MYRSLLVTKDTCDTYCDNCDPSKNLMEVHDLLLLRKSYYCEEQYNCNVVHSFSRKGLVHKTELGKTTVGQTHVAAKIERSS